MSKLSNLFKGKKSVYQEQKQLLEQRKRSLIQENMKRLGEKENGISLIKTRNRLAAKLFVLDSAKDKLRGHIKNIYDGSWFYRKCYSLPELESEYFQKLCEKGIDIEGGIANIRGNSGFIREKVCSDTQ